VSIRPGVRLAVDVGRARVGIARSDPDGLMAVPVETAPRGGALDALRHLVAEYSPLEVVVGLPLNMAGDYTSSTDDAVEFATTLASEVTIPVRLVDERLSTVAAMAGLHRSGKSVKSAKPMIDQASAVIILQHCLDTEKNTGTPPGFLVGEDVND
jgi:putative holliday junction resolvase